MRSQDTIVFKNRDRIAAKISEVNVTEIKYRLFINPDGPDYIESKENILFIKYSNGVVEYISLEKVEPAKHDVIYNRIIGSHGKYYFVNKEGNKTSGSLKTADILALTNEPFLLNSSEFKVNADKAAINVKRQRHFAIAGIPCIATGVGFMIVSFMSSTAIGPNGNDDFAVKGAVIGATLFTAGISFEVVSIINGQKKKKRLKKAIDMYNRSL